MAPQYVRNKCDKQALWNPQPVTLAPGATAHSILRVIVTGGTQPVGCAQVTAEALRVTLPRQDRSAFVPVHIPVCSKKGHSSLSVQAIQARPGVPGHPMVPDLTGNKNRRRSGQKVPRTSTFRPSAGRGQWSS